MILLAFPQLKIFIDQSAQILKTVLQKPKSKIHIISQGTDNEMIVRPRTALISQNEPMFSKYPDPPLPAGEWMAQETLGITMTDAWLLWAVTFLLPFYSFPVQSPPTLSLLLLFSKRLLFID